MPQLLFLLLATCLSFAAPLITPQGSILPKGFTLEGSNYILRPKEPPRAVVHFLGGAAIGSLPLVYRNFLETLPSDLLVVCTPYKLNLDYLEAADSIIESFSNVAEDLSEEFGPLPVYGVGHSLGAVMQCLISSLFPATPRAGNVLVGFGTRTIADSVGNEDLYNNVVLPITEVLSTGTPVIEALLKITYELSVGKVPSDDLIAQIAAGGGNVSLPKEVRDVLQIVGDLVGGISTDEGKALSAEVLRTLVQIPHVVGAVGKGDEIFPDAKGIANSIVKGYKSRRTLVLEYEDDEIGENGKLLPLINQAAEIQRTRDSMREMEVELVQQGGGHWEILKGGGKEVGDWIRAGARTGGGGRVGVAGGGGKIPGPGPEDEVILAS